MQHHYDNIFYNSFKYLSFRQKPQVADLRLFCVHAAKHFAVLATITVSVLKTKSYGLPDIQTQNLRETHRIRLNLLLNKYIADKINL